MTFKPENLRHEIKPVVFPDSKILILGTFPSPKSREYGFFYGHPRNRFWLVLSTLLKEPFPETIEEKKELLKRNHIALWDVLASCTITGASDTSIKDPVPNNIKKLIEGTEIKHIFTTGKKAESLYKKYCEKETGIKAIGLPSTSPANCTMKLDTLLERYKILLNYV